MTNAAVAENREHSDERIDIVGMIVCVILV